jgi:hypothetical protein
MENEERAQLEAHYQNDLESIKGEVARLTHLLEQVLSSKNGKRDFCTTSCCYSIFYPCYDNFSEKTKNSKKTMKTQKNAFLIYLHHF